MSTHRLTNVYVEAEGQLDTLNPQPILDATAIKDQVGTDRPYVGIADGPVLASPTAPYRHHRRLCIGVADGSISAIADGSISASPTALYRHRRRLYIGIADGSASASPTALHRHRRRLCIGIADGSVSASPTALHRHRRRYVYCAGMDVLVLEIAHLAESLPVVCSTWLNACLDACPYTRIPPRVDLFSSQTQTLNASNQITGIGYSIDTVFKEYISCIFVLPPSQNSCRWGSTDPKFFEKSTKRCGIVFFEVRAFRRYAICLV